MFIDSEYLEKTVFESFDIAKNTHKNLICNDSHIGQEYISNNIPSHDIKLLQRGRYSTDFFVCLFADMRNSTTRIKEKGVHTSFLTMHAIIPTMICIIDHYGGKVVDIPGDGIMALFKNPEYDKQHNKETFSTMASLDLMKAINKIVNPLLAKNDIPPVRFGIGIDSGCVIVTKIGTPQITDIKAIGVCINNAAKHCNGDNEIFISKSIFNNLPSYLKDEFIESISEDDWYVKRFE
jgi:adenylate cyclase